MMFHFQQRSVIFIKNAVYGRFFNFQNWLSSSCVENGRTKICIVGSGPAGFYTAQHVLKNQNVDVDIYEKLPIPFGLIRYGVAPDHPEIKNVINSFTKTALNDRVNFFGNVSVGQDVSVSKLLKAYHAVVLAYGASHDRCLNIPGEDLSNVLSAREFVGWYNGYPEHTSLNVDLNVESAAVIGQGNVALDVARILLRNTDELKTTDITEYAYEALKNSKIRRVYLIGRRGPLQVAFTVKEFREMTKLNGCQIATTLEDFDGVEETIPSIERSRKRLTELMLKIATEFSSGNRKDATKELELKFFRSPKAILRDEKGRVKGLQLCVNKLEGPSNAVIVVPTGKEEVIDCGLVLRSVGYKSSQIDPCIPFNESRSVIPNEYGRVLDRKGLYCSGWVKTGPIGVILSTMYGSFETGEIIIRDLESGHLPNDFRNGSKEILPLLQSAGIAAVTFQQWENIDMIEKEKGKARGKPREKVLELAEMLKLSGSR